MYKGQLFGRTISSKPISLEAGTEINLALNSEIFFYTIYEESFGGLSMAVEFFYSCELKD